MTPKKIILPLLFLLASLSLASRDVWAGYYMDPSQVDLVTILPPPPPPDSAEGKADLQAVLVAQRNRTAAQVKAARADAEESVFQFADVMGPGFSQHNLPFTTRFFRHVSSDTEEAVAVAKAHFDRPRPFVLDHSIEPVVGRPGGPAYPSGHATFAYVDAILLAHMEPRKAVAIFTRAAQYSYRREIAGVHYPTDLQAGWISASIIANVLLHNSRFTADLNRSAAEVRHAAKLQR